MTANNPIHLDLFFRNEKMVCLWMGLQILFYLLVLTNSSLLSKSLLPVTGMPLCIFK